MLACDRRAGGGHAPQREYIDPAGHKFYLLTGKYINLEPENDRTDEWALAHGIISVVPVAIERSLEISRTINWLPEAVAAYNRQS